MWRRRTNKKRITRQHQVERDKRRKAKVVFFLSFLGCCCCCCLVPSPFTWAAAATTHRPLHQWSKSLTTCAGIEWRHLPIHPPTRRHTAEKTKASKEEEDKNNNNKRRLLRDWWESRENHQPTINKSENISTPIWTSAITASSHK